MFKDLKRKLNGASYFLGCEIYSPDYTIKNIRFFICFGILLIIYAIHIYNMILFHHDLVRFIFCSTTFCVSLQALGKMYTWMFYRPVILDLVVRAENYITTFKCQESTRIFEKWMMMIGHIGCLIIVLFSSGCFIALIYPLIVYLFTSEWILHFGFELPGIDWTTLSGYIANVMFSGLTIFLFLLASTTTIFGTVWLIVVSFGQFEILKMLLDDLDKMIHANNKGKNDDAINKAIGVIVNVHNDLIEFVFSLIDCFTHY